MDIRLGDRKAKDGSGRDERENMRFPGLQSSDWQCCPKPVEGCLLRERPRSPAL